MAKKKLDDAFEEDIELVEEEQPQAQQSNAVHSTRGVHEERVGEAIVTSR